MGPLLLVWAPLAFGRSDAPELFCDAYSDAPACVAGAPACTTCHSLAGPPGHNPFGVDVAAARDPNAAFEDSLADALNAVADLDSDADGVSNIDEIMAGTEPGFESTVERGCADQVDTTNPHFSVGVYDPTFAWKRVMLDFCGRSPRYDEVRSFATADDPHAAIQATLDLCLQSPYWQDVLGELAIGVVEPIGPGTDISILGNWNWDLRLWAYAMSGDRDAADVLQADYLVVEEPPGRLTAIDDTRNSVEAYAQPLPPELRYGLITSRYGLAMRVMFSTVPRTLAAHAYRELLGLDIARSEGLYSIDEADGAYDWPAPADIDERGVWQEACAGCHATLDMLAYPWVRYNGIDLDGGTTGTWLADRGEDILPTTDGWIFGRPVDGPQAWVDAAVESDAFAEHTVSIFWQYLLRREAWSCEQAEYQSVWQGFRDDGRNVEEMLHQLVVTDAYGAP